MKFMEMRDIYQMPGMAFGVVGEQNRKKIGKNLIFYVEFKKER